MENEKYNTHSSRNAIEVYEKDGKWYKVYDEERKTYNVLFEALNQSRVESAGLCVPKLLETCVIDGHWAIVQEYIEGKTMKQMMESLGTRRLASVHVCSLFVKPDKLQEPIDIDYACFSIPNDFIVGYGLDYDQYGRNLREIYTLVE